MLWSTFVSYHGRKSRFCLVGRRGWRQSGGAPARLCREDRARSFLPADSASSVAAAAAADLFGESRCNDFNFIVLERDQPLIGQDRSFIRAFAATGGVVSTAGIVFGITKFALAGRSVLSIAQIGSAIGVGLLLDTMIVRTFVLPSLIALLGR
jgi:hypothetical protein